MADRMSWDHHADHHLLTAITQEWQPSQEQLRGVMGRMHQFGYTCTVKAITQHLQKLRRKEGNGPADGGSGAGSAPGTPKTPAKKRATKKDPGTGSASKHKSAAKASLSDDDEDVKPAVKKVKKEAIKKEEQDDAGSGVDYSVPSA